MRGAVPLVERREKQKGITKMKVESSIVFFPCSDIKRTEEFYTKVCGLKVHQRQGNGTVCIFDTGYGFVGFCQYGDGRPMPTGNLSPCISFNCEDVASVDAAYGEVMKSGATVISAPAKHPKYDVYSFFVSDPDGYKVEFQKIG